MQKYLVIQLARFGDLIQTKRLILTLQRDGEVHLCVDRSLQVLAGLVYPGVVVHTVSAHGAVSPAASLAEHGATFAALAAERFDGVYNLNHSPLNLAMAALFAPETVHGHRLERGQAVRSRWVRMAFRWTAWRRVAPLNLVDFWAALAPDPIAPGLVNPVATRGGQGIGVVLAGRESRRSLPPDVLATCLRAVFESYSGPRVVLLGSKAERPLARQLLQHLTPAMLDRVDDRVGRTDWHGLADSLAGLDTLLTPDTGTMHLAAHLGVPVQAFFLSSAWCHETGPYGLGHRVWQATLDCLPCAEVQPCPIGVQCLAPFRSPELLRFLSGRPDHRFPAGMLGMVASMDSVGSTWLPVFGDDAFTPRRRELRALVGEYLGLFAGEGLHDHALAELLFHETDWMLPPTVAHPRWAVPGVAASEDTATALALHDATTADATGSTRSDADATGSTLSDADATGSILSDADATGPELSDADASGPNAPGTENSA